MKEIELIKLTQLSFAILGKSLPKHCMLHQKSHRENVVEFFKWEQNQFWAEYGRPVGFYFKDEHRFQLRKKYDGDEMISFEGEELDHMLQLISDN